MTPSRRRRQRSAIGRGFVLALVALLPVPAAEAAQPLLAGRWQPLPVAPAMAAIAYERTAVWTGSELIVFGRAGAPRRNVAFSYTPAKGRWRTLSPPPGPNGSSELEGATAAIWTGRLMLVWGPQTALSYRPATDRWRQLPAAPLSPLSDAPSGLVVWTGSEMITWGGGCCGHAGNRGAAYNPATRRWRMLAPAPVAGQQRPVGAWTGHELVVTAGRGPDGRKTGGAAYDPRSDTWHRIAAPPRERLDGHAVWDGRDLLLVGGTGSPDPRTGDAPLAPTPLAYDPARDRWRTLAPMDGGRYGRSGFGLAWTGTRLLLWGGETETQGRVVPAPHGLAFDPGANRWSQLPGAPLNARTGPATVWTGHALLVWGGDPPRNDTAASDDWWPLLDGATFTPT